ncbi:MAG: hypothetical protein IBJ10_04630 [Phycisphaerales bacterium]|nr:hypothetical protein [Phycisphaerales bacterium]
MGPGIVTPWVPLPIAGALMALVAWHAAGIERSDEPLSRRRIRVMNGWVMLVCLPLLAAGFSLVNPHARPKTFAIVWLGAASLLLLSVALAVADALNTVRLSRARAARLSDALRDAAERVERGAP